MNSEDLTIGARAAAEILLGDGHRDQAAAVVAVCDILIHTMADRDSLAITASQLDNELRTMNITVSEANKELREINRSVEALNRFIDDLSDPSSASAVQTVLATPTLGDTMKAESLKRIYERYSTTQVEEMERRMELLFPTF